MTLEFPWEEFTNLDPGHCAACGAALSSGRRYTYTCDAVCHQGWIERIVAAVGETKLITYTVTGKTYRVPTRVILEAGIKAADLPNYPEA